MVYDRDVSLEALKEMLDYDPATGEIRWRKSPARNIYAGEVAGCTKTLRKNKQGNDVPYRYIRLNGVNIPAQRIAYALHHGSFPQGRLTFIDGDTLNLRADNLEMQRVSRVLTEEEREGRREYYRRHREQNGISYRESDIKKRFGITLFEYGQMLVAQGGKCAICGQENAGTRNGEAKAFSVDHDHKTGKVRGLLCEPCNQGIGKLKDDPSLLRKAADYIERHSTGDQ